jgi:hypothetical protein
MTKRRTMMSSVAVAALALGVAGQTPLMATNDAGGITLAADDSVQADPVVVVAKARAGYGETPGTMSG